MGLDCGTAVEYTSCDLDVVGFNPSECWTFFYPFSNSSLNRSIVEVKHCRVSNNVYLDVLHGAKLLNMQRMCEKRSYNTIHHMGLDK